MACFPRSLTTATFFSTALGSDASALVCTCFFIESGVTSGRRAGSSQTDVTWIENASPDAGRNRSETEGGT